MVIAQILFDSEAKVSKVCLRTIGTDKYIVRLHVPMVYAVVVARLDVVDNLEENALEESIFLMEDLPLYDRTVQIATRAIVQHEEDELVVFDDVVESNDAGMMRHVLMSGDLASLAFANQSRAVKFGKNLDSVLLWLRKERRENGVALLLDSKVDNPVASLAKGPDQQETTSVD